MSKNKPLLLRIESDELTEQLQKQARNAVVTETRQLINETVVKKIDGLEDRMFAQLMESWTTKNMNHDLVQLMRKALVELFKADIVGTQTMLRQAMETAVADFVKAQDMNAIITTALGKAVIETARGSSPAALPAQASES